MREEIQIQQEEEAFFLLYYQKRSCANENYAQKTKTFLGEVLIFMEFVLDYQLDVFSHQGMYYGQIIWSLMSVNDGLWLTFNAIFATTIPKLLPQSYKVN